MEPDLELPSWLQFLPVVWLVPKGLVRLVPELARHAKELRCYLAAALADSPAAAASF